jgi:hypothetical protein
MQQVPLDAFPTERQATITFSGLPDNTKNPVFTPSDYNFGGDPNAPTVSFGGFFIGQSSNNNITVSGNPSKGPFLALDTTAPQTFTFTISNGNKLLTGRSFQGPIALLLSRPVAAIGVSRMPCDAPCTKHLVGWSDAAAMWPTT